MKYTLLSIFTLIILAISFYPQKELISKENGSPGAKTNSPLDGQNCTGCHAGSINSGAGTTSITTNIPSGGYIPGSTYTITTTVTQAGINKFGFELTAEDLSVKQGTFLITNASETKFATGTSNTGVTHKQAGTSGTNTKSWDCDWEAPASGAGDITFYAATLAANLNGNNNGDDVYANSIMVSELIANPGCTDSLALNYNPLATIDDGSCTYQITIVPDDHFETYLEANGMGDGIALNDSVFTPAIDTVISLDVSSLSIADLTGIEDFIALDSLNCSHNNLDTLDVSNNTALYYLRCDSNQITSLDLSNNTTLTNLRCSSNQLTSLDVSNNTALNQLWCDDNQLTILDVSNNTALTYLICYWNQLTSLDVSNNAALYYLHCGGNQLTILDVSNNTALTYLFCYFNQLTSLDVSNNTALTYLNCGTNQFTNLDVTQNTGLITFWCWSNQLANLDLTQNTDLLSLRCQNNQLTSLDVSQNTALIYLYCSSNNLDTLDVSANTALTSLQCYSNQLTSLDIRNGNNTNMSTSSSYLKFTNNPQLYCIDVDDVAWADTNWTVAQGNIDSWASFSSNCATAVFGCTDSLALNYDSLATINDSSCVYCNLTSSVSVTDISCFGLCNGSVSVSVSGGGGYLYLWSNGQTTSTATNLCAGMDTCNITDTTTGCEVIIFCQVSEPAQITIATSTTDVSCYDLCDGTAELSPSGGTPPFSFFWNNGQQTQTATGLCSGSWNCIITDGNGCMVQESILIEQPLSPLSVSVDSTDETSALNDGSATATVLGGTPPYTYAWNIGQTTSTATNLAPGLYTVDVTDANGCVISDATSVNAYTPTGVITIKNISKTLIRITDVLGRETKQTNQPLFYIYDNGTVEKRIVID